MRTFRVNVLRHTAIGIRLIFDRSYRIGSIMFVVEISHNDHCSTGWVGTFLNRYLSQLCVFIPLYLAYWLNIVCSR